MRLLRRNASVRETLRAMMMLTTLPALLLACVAFAGSDLISTRRTVEEDLQALADVIGSNSAAALTFGDRESAVQILGALSARPSIVGARIYTSSGHPFATRRVALVNIPAAAPPVGAGVEGGVLVVVRRITFRGEIIGSIYIASDLREMSARIRQFAIGALVILVVSVLVALVVSSKLQRILSDPIRNLAAVAERVRNERDYSARTHAVSPPAREIGDLMSAFNEMLAQIELRDEELQHRRADLEEQVAKRTSELSAAKDEAERISRHNQMILNTAAEGIFELDRNGIATFVNVVAARLLGYSVDELIGSRLHDLVHTEEVQQLDVRECHVCSSFLLPPARTGHSLTLIARDGRRFPIEYTTSTVQSPAGPTGVVITFRDITSRVEVDRLKDEFVSTVSHELRTPLTSIRGALGLLAGGVLGAVGDRARRMLEIAVINTERLMRLINDILDLERISSGRVELNRGFASAGELVQEAATVVQTIADRAGVSISWESDDTLLWVDRDRLVQTLTNLLSNAVKFSAPGSSVLVRGAIADDMFLFSVEDHGRGIPADKLECVFERFTQVDASDSRDKGGSGLGLAISRSIVAAHGGAISADSTPGKGSTFYFTVPIANAPASPTARPVAVPGEISDRCSDAAILIVEDDSDLAHVISTTLEDRGLRSVIAASGEDAIAACESATPVMMILDLRLPGIDGFAVVEWLRAQCCFASMPLLVYSANEVSAGDRERLRLGPTMFLTKRCDPLASLPHHIMTLLEVPFVA